MKINHRPNQYNAENKKENKEEPQNPFQSPNRRQDTEKPLRRRRPTTIS